MSYVLKEDSLTPQIIGAAIQVHAALGPGLLEKAYERCLKHKLELEGFEVHCQVPIPIVFEGLTIPDAYKIDLIVNSTLLIELKSVEKLHETHLAQVITYLKLSKLKYGLLLNFNTIRLIDGIRRVLNDN
jgi:GxxExxY protein